MASMGPRFNGVEDLGIAVHHTVEAAASMGPRFNGVEDLPLLFDTPKFKSSASMGPRFNGVEDPSSLKYFSASSALQWGHALMAWKTVYRRAFGILAERASMGPRFNGVEDLEAILTNIHAVNASMGPRFNGVEDLASYDATTTQSPASMGPRFNGVEDAFVELDGTSRHDALQWGHALMAWKTLDSADTIRW